MQILEDQLKEFLDELKKTNNEIDTINEDILDNLYSVYPFNKFEYIISHLIAAGIINLQQYLEMRNDYLQRNKYLHIFEITAPRTFGENWAQNHLNEVVPELLRPSKKYDSSFSGQYDFWYEGIRIEVKASRAVKKETGGTLLEKALSSESSEHFEMNFQQIKPDCSDIFVWIAVWKDKIRYWVLTSNEIKNNKYYSKGQHRGNVGEGQLWITNENIKQFERYEVGVRDILDAIIYKYKREQKNK